MVLPSSKFTSIKEKSDTNLVSNSSTKSAQFLNLQHNTQPTGKTVNKIDCNLQIDCVDLTDTNSRLTGTSTISQNTLDKLKSGIVDLDMKTSKTPGETAYFTQSKSQPSSPDSDSELLKPAFHYNGNDCSSAKTYKNIVNCNKSNCYSSETSKAGFSSESLVDISQKVPGFHSATVTEAREGRDLSRSECGLKENSEALCKDACSDEPVRKKKRTKEEVEIRKKEALVSTSCVKLLF